MPDRARFLSRTPRAPLGPRPAVLALALAGAFGNLPSHGQTLPTGGVAVHGQAVITQPAANQLRVVTQNGAGTNHSAINWQSFSVGAGNTATIVQPSSGSLSINRVVTATPSAIFGTLSSNGRLVLVNQSGIAVGAGAVIDTAGFTASALRMSDADALAGRLRFGDPSAAMGGAAGLTVGGRITARDGDIVLVAPNIELGGSALLQAPNGSTVLAAGQQVEITGRGLEGITMLVQAPADQARNLGRLEGNAVGIFAGTLRHSGEIQATTATLEGGTVVLKAAGDAIVDGAAKVLATGTTGGKVDVLGQRVAVTGQTLIDVSGTQGGGSIRVGGDYQGKNPNLPNAQRTYLGPQAELRADAVQRGDGGRIIVWADDVTRAYGTIHARGGAQGGNGGFAEVSGRHHLEFQAAVDLRAPRGDTGSLLLDPDFIDVALVGFDSVTDADQFSDPISTVTLSAAVLGAIAGNVMLQSNGDITFSSALTMAVPGASITALAGNMIRVDAPITTLGGAVTLHSAAPGATGTGSTDSDAVYVNAPITTNGGTISLRADSCDLGCDSVVIGGALNAGGGTIVLQGASDIRQSGSGSLTASVLQVTGEGVIDLNLSSNNISSDVSLITNTLTAGTSLVQFHNSASSFLLNNASAKGNITIAAAGSLSTDGGILSTTGNVSITALNGMSFGDDVSAAGTLSLNSTNANIVQTAGAMLVGGTATINAGSGDIGLNRSTNDFSTVALTGGNINLRDSSALAVSSLVRNGANKSLTLVAGGSLSVSPVAIDAGIGQIELRGGGVLSTPGQLTAGSIILEGTGGINLTNNVILNGGLLELAASSGSITQSGGQISAPGGMQTLFSAAGVHVNLSAAGNDFGEILGATGSLTLVDQNSITVSSIGGGISSNAGNISLTATGVGALTLNGNVNAGSGNVTLSAHGSITQPGGTLTANTVTASSSVGSISLDRASNNFAAARVTASGASTVTISDLGNLAISGAGGSLVVSGSGTITVDQTLNFADTLQLGAATGLTLAANVTAGGNVTMSSGGAGIQQTGGVLDVTGGTASFTGFGGTGDVLLSSAGNNFNVVNLSGRHITAVAGSSGMIVNSLSSGANANVYLQAGTGGLILPGTAINAGTGQVSLLSDSTLLGMGALTGSIVLVHAPSGISITDNITASSSLQMSSGVTGITQTGGAIQVAGPSSFSAGTGPVSLTQPGNDFASIGVTGGVVSLQDSNGVVLDGVSAATSLTVNANGNVSQTAPAVISGTTTVNAGIGNVTLTTAGNNLNVLNVAGNAINVVEGAGSSLTVNTLSSGANQPVSLAAGHTLTLPATVINAGSADINLTSPIGPLVIPGALVGSNINLSSGQGLTVNAPINAAGNFTATVSGDFVSTVTQGIQVGGSMGMALGGGLEVSAVSQQANLNAGAGQTINAKYLSLTTTGSGSTKIYNQTGVQAITTHGQNGAGEGILLRNAGTGANSVGIINDGTAQTITVNNANVLRLQGVSGEVDIHSAGAQTITLQGASSANLLEIGQASNAGHSEIIGNGQTITAGQTGQAGGITIVAGTTDDRGAGIANDSGLQIVKTTGTITLQAGTAPGVAGPDCLSTGGVYGGSCAFIGSDGAALQTVAATNIQLFGGTSGSLNLAVIGNLNPAGSQLLELHGGGDLTLIGGSGSGNGNRAVVQGAGVSQSVNWLAGGDLTLSAGAVGTRHLAQVVMGNSTGTQSLTGATGMTLTAGATGGGSSAGNRAMISSSGSQSLAVGSGGITLIAGGGTGLETDNDAQIFQGGGAGTSQSITVSSGGGITMTGGSSALQNVGGSSHGSRALIEGDGDSQTIAMTGGGDISLTGGTNGSRAFAQIFAGNSATQSITGAGTITLTGGASGGGSFSGVFEGNRAVIATNAGSQTIQAADILLTGGAGGQGNRAEIFSGGDQSIAVSNGLDLQGGGGGGGAGNLGNSALVQTTVGNQTISVGAGGLTMTGGSGGAGNINNAALLRLGDNTIARPGKAQSITMNGGGSITLNGGNTSETAILAADCGSCAVLRTDGDSQQITFTSGGNLSATGGTVGARNQAAVFANFDATQTVTGASSIALVGGVTGGGVGTGNFAFLGTNSGSQSVSVGAGGIALLGGGGGVENTATLRQSTSTGSTTGSQSITIGGGGSISVNGGGGTSNFARVQSFGAAQSLNFTAGGGVSVVGGTGASGSFARIDAVNGSQSITGAPNVTVQGGASGGADLNGNFASINASAAGATQTIVSSGMTLSAGASGTNNFAVVQANVQNLTVHGNLALVGGGSSPSLDGTQGGGARIGASGTSATDLTLVVDNNLTMTGGSVSGAAIGSGIAGGGTTALDITVGGAVTLNPGSVSTAGARIGSPAAAPSAGDISLVAGGAVSLLGTVAGETAIRTLGRVDVQGNTLDIRNTVSGSEVALHGLVGVALSGVAAVDASAAGTALKVIADSGTFSNSAGPGALSTPNGRWLVYSADPTVDTRGGLVYDFKQYDALPGDTVLGTGNGFLYSIAPTVTASLVGTVSKTYDGTDVATLSATNYTATGIDGDTVTLNNPASGTYDTKSVGTGKLVTVGGLSVVSAVDGSAPVYGYNPVVAPASASIGSIGSATISAITGITAANKVYDSTQVATLTTTGASFTGMAIGDTLTVTGATGLFDTKDVGTGKTVNISGLVLAGADSANYTLTNSTATTTANITPASISAITGISAANKVYDGTTSATLTTSSAAFTGRLGSDVLTVATAVGNFSDKNVANPKTVNVTGLSLGGADAGNYTLANTTATTAAAITPATISAVGGLTASKVYDGSTGATAVTTGATFTGAVPGDNLTVTVASASFADKNVGTGKVLTASGLTLGGTDAGNYSFAVAASTGTGVITQRPLATWTGAGGDGLWANPLNWDAIPDLSNVAAVSIPAGAGSITFDSSVGATSLQTISSLRPLAITSGSLAVSNTLAVEDFSQSGGALTGAGSLIATNSFSQTGGSIAMGSLTLVQNSGNLSFTNLSGTTVALVAPAGAISQSGPLVAGTLTSSSQSGTTLTNAGNQISNLFAENLGTGVISVTSTGPMNVLGLANVDGDISVSAAGAMSVFGPVTSATGSVSLAATGASGNLGLFAPVTAGNQVVLDAAQTLTQDAAVTGTSGVTADAGVSIVFGTFATANYAPVVYRVNGVVVASPATDLVVGDPVVEAAVEQVKDVIKALAALVDPLPMPKPSDFTADGKLKNKEDATIVAEGEVCK
ncbi:MAG: YDG domain-containing protein [Rhodoferax sp.]